MRFPLLACAIGLSTMSLAFPAAGQVVVWNNPWGGPVSFYDSYWNNSQYVETADDFDVVGPVSRILAQGAGPGCPSCPDPAVIGARVRFYEWTTAGPGALQHDVRVTSGAGFLHHDIPETLDITLPAPFEATGRHYISVQVEFEGNPTYWEMWTWYTASASALGPNWQRSSNGGSWIARNQDVAFQLFGPGSLPPGSDPCGPWAEVPVPVPQDAFSTRLTDVDGEGTNLWAVGTEYQEEQIGGLTWYTMTMRWTGTAWERVPSPSPTDCDVCTEASLGAVGVVSPTDVWAAGSAVVRNGHLEWGAHILVLRWDGASWSVAPTPDLGGGSGGSIADIKVVAPDDVWFVGQPMPPANAPYPALAMRWNGSDFEIHPVPIVNPQVGRDGGNPLYAIDGTGPNDLWAVGGTDVQAIGDGAADWSQIHHWDGERWTHVPGPTPGIYNELWSVEAIAPDDVWAAGEYWDVNGIFALLLHWDGSAWTQVASPGGILDFHAFAADNIYAVGTNHVWHYDGALWTLVQEFPEPPTTRLGAIDATGPCELWAVGMREFADWTAFSARVVPQCSADLNRDGFVDGLDYDEFNNAFEAGDPSADYNADGYVDGIDYDSFNNDFEGGC